MPPPDRDLFGELGFRPGIYRVTLSFGMLDVDGPDGKDAIDKILKKAMDKIAAAGLTLVTTVTCDSARLDPVTRGAPGKDEPDQ